MAMTIDGMDALHRCSSCEVKEVYEGGWSSRLLATQKRSPSGEFLACQNRNSEVFELNLAVWNRFSPAGDLQQELKSDVGFESHMEMQLDDARCCETFLENYDAHESYKNMSLANRDTFNMLC